LFKKSFLGGKNEERVIEKIKKHIKILCTACETFKNALEKQDIKKMLTVSDLEREGDIVRREVLSNIYEGAFLPFIRPNICKFVEIVDNALDELKNAAQAYDMGLKLDKDIKTDCIGISHLNLNMCEMLSITFEALCEGKDLREKILVIRIYEKKVDEIKLDLVKKLMGREIKTFWEGKILSDFISYLSNISDIIEDASDYLQILNISIR